MMGKDTCLKLLQLIISQYLNIVVVVYCLLLLLLLLMLFLTNILKLKLVELYRFWVNVIFFYVNIWTAWFIDFIISITIIIIIIMINAN